MSALTDIFGLDNQPWMAEGFCADTLTPDLWFPSDRYESQALAEELCGGCPSRDECFRYSMEHGLLGVWGGTTTTQREELRTNPRCGTRAGYKRHRDAKEMACGPCNEASNEYARQRAANKRAEVAA